MDNPIETVEFDAETRRYHAEYDPGSVAPSVAVIDVVRSVFDEGTTREPLYAVVDPDALDRLLETRPGDDRCEPRTVSFPYARMGVTVTSDGRITIRPSEERGGADR